MGTPRPSIDEVQRHLTATMHALSDAVEELPAWQEKELLEITRLLIAVQQRMHSLEEVNSLIHNRHQDENHRAGAHN